jgi:hypothetical protein
MCIRESPSPNTFLRIERHLNDLWNEKANSWQDLSGLASPHASGFAKMREARLKSGIKLDRL